MLFAISAIYRSNFFLHKTNNDEMRIRKSISNAHGAGSTQSSCTGVHWLPVRRGAVSSRAGTRLVRGQRKTRADSSGTAGWRTTRRWRPSGNTQRSAPERLSAARRDACNLAHLRDILYSWENLNTSVQWPTEAWILTHAAVFSLTERQRPNL